MDLLAILRTLRRHWILIVSLAVLGALVGVGSTLFKQSDTKQSRTYYKATNTLVVDFSRSSQVPAAFQGLDQVAIYATTGEVPDAVAKAMDSDVSGRKLAEQITTTTNGSTSTIALTAVDPDADQAVLLADTWAKELVTNLDARGTEAYETSRDNIQSRLDTLQATEDSLLAQLAIAPRIPNYDNVKAQYDATVNQYRITYDSYAQLSALGPPTSRFQELQKAAEVPISEGEYAARLNLGAKGLNNLSASSSSGAQDGTVIATSAGTSTVNGPVSRGVLGFLLGLLAGIGIAFVVDRLDRRLRTRAEAEAAFTLPVLAEVPEIKRSQQKDREIVSHTAPLSRVAEAHRAIRSSLLFSRAAMQQTAGANGATAGAGNGNGNGVAGGTLFEPEHDEPLVVMITSAAPGEGKTTTTANLATVFAEAGSSVLVVNCDFRRPMIHRYFGVEDEPRRVLETNIPGVKVVTNVLPDANSNPAQVVAAQRQVVAAARGRFDVILLDTAPLLTANDAVELVGSADLLLLVARIGSTSTDNVERTIDLLNRLDVPLAGVVLVGSAAAQNDYYYYYQPGRVDEQGPTSPRATAVKTNGANGGPTKSDDAELFVPDDAKSL